MKIIVDAHGGDNAPLEIVKGAALAVGEYGVDVALCGREDELRALSAAHGIPLNGIEFIPAELSMPVEAEPAEVLKSYAGSSLAVGLKKLADGTGDAFVTAGSTGAAVVGASMLVKRIKGIKRCAIGTIIPNSGGCYMLIDCGANSECRPEMLQQFAVLGSAYMSRVMGIKSPRVAVVNIGAEETKGLPLQIEAAKLLRDTPVNFIGNVEARELPLGGCDVAVCDGFVGNVVLKLTEGMGKLIGIEFKNIFMRNVLTKIGALLVKGGVDEFKKTMDYTEYGGAPLMGIAKPVIKAHGSSNAKAIKNAIRQAKIICENSMIEQITQSLSALKTGEISDE